MCAFGQRIRARPVQRWGDAFIAELDGPPSHPTDPSDSDEPPLAPSLADRLKAPARSCWR
jgi:hypothetical protein